MKLIHKYLTGAVVAGMLLVAPACNIDEIPNPNAPTQASLEEGASLDDLQLLVSGLESVLRFDMEYYYWTTAMVGREYYDLRGTDPRYTGELLGAEGAPLDNNGFLTTRAWGQAYKAIRNSILLVNATAKSRAGLTDAQKTAITGFAKTIEAYNLLLVLNRHKSVRLDVSDINNLSPVVQYDAGLAGVEALLNEAHAALNAASAEPFPLSLSSGFAGFETNGDLAKFNKAILARVQMYKGDKTQWRAALGASFLDANGDLGKGVYHIFGLAGNDERNPLFVVPDQDIYTVHPSFLADAEAGDTRVANKVRDFDPAEVTIPVQLDDLFGEKQVAIYDDPTTSMAIIRNEELVLMWAEANIGTDNAATIAAINKVRNAAGLANYAGANTDAALLDEVLKQRRYALFGEGHYWLDMRRTGRLGQIPKDRPGDIVHEFFPVPIQE
jgi:starch-binding outer membrane protein, SusD/RagB family